MTKPTPFNVLLTLESDGLTAVRGHAEFASRSHAEALSSGDNAEASFWRRAADRWLGKLADLVAA